jgi:hypothetical protein
MNKYKDWTITYTLDILKNEKFLSIIFQLLKRFIDYTELYELFNKIDIEICVWLYLKRKNGNSIGSIIKVRNYSLNVLKIFEGKSREVLIKMAEYSKNNNLTEYSKMIEIKKSEITAYDIRMFVLDDILNIKEVYIDEGYHLFL